MTEVHTISKQEAIQSGASTECPFTSRETVNTLTNGLVSHYQVDATRVKTQLDELTKKQTNLIEKLEKENARFSDSQETYNLHDMFAKVKQYQSKLLMIKKEMVQIHERTAKVKKRALKLQNTCQKEALMREQKKEEQLQREQQLIAKPGMSRKSKP